MCTALFFYDVHPTLLFLLAFNREEYQERCGLCACALQTLPLQKEWRSTKGIDNLLNNFAAHRDPAVKVQHLCHQCMCIFCRPTAPAHFWQDHPDLLAGKDLKGGGTWLGVTRSGRVAWLTNFREVHAQAHRSLSISGIH